MQTGPSIDVRGPVANPDEIRGSTVDDPYVTEALEGEPVVSDPLRTGNGTYVGIISAPIRENGNHRWSLRRLLPDSIERPSSRRSIPSRPPPLLQRFDTATW
ncbi:MAG: hypothetical protein U5K37_11365 [Natrialbaceae archaeon]|nr:hypothetical protein [Natrialbaceae archaeon]